MHEIDPENPPLAVIFGIAGESLTPEEKAFFQQANPLGFILFARNCKDKTQLKNLVKDLHECLGREAPILIDQEGGRVQRLRAPEWTDYPPAKSFGEGFLKDFSKGRKALEDNTQAIAAELTEAGINVNCAPVMDVLYPETHEAIGNRAFSGDPEMVAALGATVCRKYLEGRIIPVIKHIPGQGRAALDSHKDLPVVGAPVSEMKKTDYLPFKEILTKAFSEAVWGMVSHVIYKDIDERAPASCSRRVIFDTIRKDIGFSGLLLSDDICMGALETMGGPEHRAEKVLRAGCDVALHCNGDLEEMQKVAKRAEKMTNDAVMRYNRSVSWLNRNIG
ncbi:MAG: beta-N-acetylhexosaminidase [Rhodospirillales bacterium]|nr:beta-N-acetylhexosaminidase [Rhodospirillales bacterium]MCB9995037.1 beta-N-acetylhexosaminidase [Rhodospirillales bacterium]